MYMYSTPTNRTMASRSKGGINTNKVNAAPAANNRQLPKAQLHKRGAKQLVISRYFNHEIYCWITPIPRQ
jgi:hypothetical protein